MSRMLRVTPTTYASRTRRLRLFGTAGFTKDIAEASDIDDPLARTDGEQLAADAMQRDIQRARGDRLAQSPPDRLQRAAAHDFLVLAQQQQHDLHLRRGQRHAFLAATHAAGRTPQRQSAMAGL